jgi:hypothetical protein
MVLAYQVTGLILTFGYFMSLFANFALTPGIVRKKRGIIKGFAWMAAAQGMGCGPGRMGGGAPGRG